MSNYRYILKPYKGPASRGRCPACNKPREFAIYIDTETGQPLADHVGRCNREQHCGYHFTPKQYFEDGSKRPESNHFNRFNTTPEPVKPIDPLPIDFLIQSGQTKHYQRNNLYRFMQRRFTDLIASLLFKRYFIGTSNHWEGATSLPQIDLEGNFRQCKLMLFNPDTGRRVRAGSQVRKFNRESGQFETITADQDCTKIYGKYLSEETKGLNLQQTFFGAHLLPEHPNKPIGLVESEKTALIASVYFPDYIWLATGGKYGCRWTDYSVNKILAGRTVVMWPDAFYNPEKKSPYQEWSERAEIIRDQVKCKIKVSDWLERVATEEQKSNGWDLADFLVIPDESVGLALKNGYPAFWDYRIQS